jgi:hypothetical protein
VRDISTCRPDHSPWGLQSHDINIRLNGVGLKDGQSNGKDSEGWVGVSNRHTIAESA